MNLTVEQAAGRVPVTILAVHGDLDASSYQALIARARELYASGTRHVLIDMSDVPYMGSSGLVALHSIAVLLRREPAPDPEAGWGAFHNMGRDRDTGLQQLVKLLSPRPSVNRVLETAGMQAYFPVFTDRAEAVASF